MSAASRLTLRVLPALLAGAVVSGVQAPPAAEMRTLTYASRDGVDLRLDLYLPAQPVRRPIPVIVFLHGGGWSGGTRTTGPDFSRYFVRDGFAMASIDYRLTPSVTFPANVEDVRTAIRWLKANASAHTLDPGRICLWGTSAGGHLAAVAALAPRGVLEPLEPRLDRPLSNRAFCFSALGRLLSAARDFPPSGSTNTFEPSSSLAISGPQAFSEEGHAPTHHARSLARRPQERSQAVAQSYPRA